MVKRRGGAVGDLLSELRDLGGAVLPGVQEPAWPLREEEVSARVVGWDV